MKLFDGDYDQYLDINFLKSTGARPHFFLDFIQLKLNDQYRMHFWHPSLPAFGAEEELHDHRYDFHSRVLFGKTTHEEWHFEADENGRYEMIEKDCRPGSAVQPLRVGTGNIKRGGVYSMVAGSDYLFPKDAFHRLSTDNCITLLERGPVVKDFARIIKEIDKPDFCPSEKIIPEAELWEIIEEMVGKAKPALPCPGYHLREIERGVFGEASKIVEEIEEFKEALEQGVDLMALIELSDAMGAIDGYLAKHHPSITMETLKTFSKVTQRAFINGHR